MVPVINWSGLSWLSPSRTPFLMIFPLVIKINILVSFLWQLVFNLSVQGVGTILTVIWDHYKWNNDGLDWDSNLGPLNLYIMSMLYQLSYLATLNEPAWSIHMHIYMLMFIINLKIVSQWGWQKLHVHKIHIHCNTPKRINKEMPMIESAGSEWHLLCFTAPCMKP